MNLQSILDRKGTQVHQVAPTATLAEAVRLMVEHNCGSLVVMDEDLLLGIISERDILRTIADDRRSLSAIPVAERMTRRMVTAQPEDEISHTMGVMSRFRIRHLPVLVNDRLVGLVSIGDLVKAQHEQLAVENHFLMNYIQG